MNEDMLNSLFAKSLEWGDNAAKPIIEVATELFPHLLGAPLTEMSSYIKTVKTQIRDYFYDRYDYKDDKKNSCLQKEGYEWIKANYQWMSSENITRAISQGMYYAWHG